MLTLLGTSQAFAVASILLWAPPATQEVDRGPAAADPGAIERVLAGGSSEFIENGGQWDPAIRFLARRADGALAVERDALTWSLCGEHARSSVRLRFDGASASACSHGLDPFEPVRAFFIGRERWAPCVRSYREVEITGLYDGVDLRLHDDLGSIEYDLVLAAGADPGLVSVACDGAWVLAVDEDGALLLDSPAGVLRQSAPATFELAADGSRRSLECRYRVIDATHFGFVIEGWSGEHAAVIDPTFTWSTFLGGNCHDYVHAIAVDPTNGDLIVGGQTASFNFPVTPGSYDQSCGCSCPTMGPFVYDGFLARMDPTGATLKYATYFGGTVDSSGSPNTGTDSVNALAVASDGQVVCAGTTSSIDFPVTPLAFATTYAGGAHDGFVAKLRLSAPPISLPTFSSYLGGSDDDTLAALMLDTNVPTSFVVAGATRSSDFPVTVAAYDTTANGGWDAVVTRVNATGSALAQSTYLGGAADEVYGAVILYGGDDPACSVARDALGSVVVAGATASNNFPTTFNALDRSANGAQDVFVTKLNANLSTLTWSTFFGGWSTDHCMDVADDGDNGAWICGSTTSDQLTPPVFPITANAYDLTFNGTPLLGYSDGWIAHIAKPTPRQTLAYSTYIGGDCAESMQSLALTPLGKVVVVGWTSSSANPPGSTPYPTTPGAFDTVGKAQCGTVTGQDAVLTGLDPALGAAGLLYSTYFAGTYSDVAVDLVVLPAGPAILFVGNTLSFDLPAVGGFNLTYNGGIDAFIAQF